MNATVIALSLLWIGAACFGGLVMLRGRWQQAAAAGRPIPAAPTRKTVEAALTFAGTGGMILGLGLLALGAIR